METNIQTALAVVREAGRLPVTWNSIDECTREVLEWKNTIGLGVYRIGQALIWAKAKLGHGAFGDWLRDEVDFSPSTAQNYMRIAREVDEGSSIARLPYTKVLALLDVPKAEREAFAETIDAEHKSAAEIRRLTAELAESRKAGEQLGMQLDRARKDAAAAAQALEAERAKPAQMATTAEGGRLSRPEAGIEGQSPSTIVVEQAPADYLRIKSEAEALRRRLADSEAEADRLADELDRRKLQEAGAEPTDALCNRIVSGIGGLMAMVGQLPEQLRREPGRMTEDEWSLTCNRVNALYRWCQLMLGANPYGD